MPLGIFVVVNVRLTVPPFDTVLALATKLKVALLVLATNLLVRGHTAPVDR